MAEQPEQHKRGSEEADDGERARQNGKKPRCGCYCPNHGCDEAFASPAKLLDHFRTTHPVKYGRPCEVALPLPGGVHVLVGEADRRVFLVCSSALGHRSSAAVSLVCVREDADAAAAPQFDSTLSLLLQPPPPPGPGCGGVESRKAATATVAFPVPSSDLLGELVAAELPAFLGLRHTPALLPVAVRIDRAGTGGSTTDIHMAGSVPGVEEEDVLRVGPGDSRQPRKRKQNSRVYGPEWSNSR